VFLTRQFLFGVGVILSLLLAGSAVGQMNPFASSEAMDTMSEAPVTGGLQTSTYMNKAGGVSRQPTRGAGMPGGVGMMPDEFGGRGGRAAMMAEPSVAPGMIPTQATPIPTPKKIRVLAGSRVQCAVSGALLEDIVYKEVEETNKGEYYDDGTHGDAEAGDGTYTNITVKSDVMSPESHEILQRLLSLLETVEGMEPMDFYRLNVVTSEPLSSIPKQISEQQDRDIKLTEWNDRFLRVFRKDENNPKSDFYPLYVPPPPAYPNVPLPDGFQPVTQATPTPAAGRGIGGEMPGITGEGRGGHKGAYYDEGRMGDFF